MPIQPDAIWCLFPPMSNHNYHIVYCSAVIDCPSVDTGIDKRAFLLLADISTQLQGCRHKIVPWNIAILQKKCFLPEMKWHSLLNDCCFDMCCKWINWYVCALAKRQYVYLTMGSEKIYKSCGIFIALLCYYLNIVLLLVNYVSGKIGPDFVDKEISTRQQP